MRPDQKRLTDARSARFHRSTPFPSVGPITHIVSQDKTIVKKLSTHGVIMKTQHNSSTKPMLSPTIWPVRRLSARDFSTQVTVTVAVGASVCVSFAAADVVAVAGEDGKTARRVFVLCRQGSADQQRVWLGLFGGPRHSGIDLSCGTSLLCLCKAADEQPAVVVEAFANVVLRVIGLVVDVLQSSLVEVVLKLVIEAVMVRAAGILASASCRASGP